MNKLNQIYPKLEIRKEISLGKLISPKDLQILTFGVTYLKIIADHPITQPVFHVQRLPIRFLVL
jgi:hypothetical protein